MSTSDKNQLEDSYVNLSQQGASLIHHVSTPLAIARVNVDFLSRYLGKMLENYQQSAKNSNQEVIPEEHLQAIMLAPQLISEQLDVIQSRVKTHWQSINKEVAGHVPEYQISVSGNKGTLEKLIKNADNAKILLVEDEVIHRDIAVKVLSPSYQIDLAKSGEEALELCRSTHYDLILMDLYLPGINGQEAARQIRASASRHSIIVGLTNMPFGSQEEQDNLNAYLTKPLTLKALNSCLAKIQRVSSEPTPS